MPVPVPADDEAVHGLPAPDEAQALADGVASAAAPASGLTHLQRVLIEALFKEMTSRVVDVSTPRPTTPEEFARLLARRNLATRERMVQVILLTALVLRPLPKDVADRIDAFAAELCVDDGMARVAHDFGKHAYALAAKDFDRNGYVETWHPDAAAELHTAAALESPWAEDVDDPELAARWAALEQLPRRTLGRGVWEMYQARGFQFPGRPGSAPPLLAQHDWVHVLADYGTTVESELEVFGFIARANDDMHAFSLLAMVVSLFETGALKHGAGLFDADRGHLSRNESVAIRLADAMRRGAECHDTLTGSHSVDFLRIDWFEVAALTLDEARARFAIPAKSDDACAAGSVGPWDVGGISPYQLNAGQKLAAESGRTYDSYGAAVAT
ncbi:MAG TPA: hypothetical protein VHD87_02335 [Acidimicrobiales bacterium]|nr:hypothetical protein [Acidimicrobiales bacterium]